MYYVTMTDRFMSGWGPAKNLTNKLIFLCDSYEQAEIVSNNARNRSDQKNVNICSCSPRYYRKSKTDYVLGSYYVQVKTKEEYPNWYTPGFFKK